MKGQYYYNKMSKEHRTLFLKNMVAEDNLTFDFYMTFSFESFEIFIIRAFIWGNTPEGQKYWFDVSQLNIK